MKHLADLPSLEELRPKRKAEDDEVRVNERQEGNVEVSRERNLPEGDDPLPNPERTERQGEDDVKIATMSVRTKNILKVALTLFILGSLAGIAYGIYFTVDYYRPKAIGQESTTIRFQDGSKLTYVKAQLQDNNIAEPDVRADATFVYRTGKNGARLLQDSTEILSNYDVFINNRDIGVITRVQKNGNLSFMLNPIPFYNAAAVDRETSSRLLQDATNAVQQAEYAKVEQEALAYLDNTFSEAVENLTNFNIKFTEDNYVKYSFNAQSNLMEPQRAVASSNGANPQRRMLWRSFRRWVNRNVVRPIKVVSAVTIGTAIAGPAGGVAGAALALMSAGEPTTESTNQLASSAPVSTSSSASSAEVMANICIPEDSKNMYCNAALLTKATGIIHTSDYLKNFAAGVSVVEYQDTRKIGEIMNLHN